jgi:hypothetical protein
MTSQSSYPSLLSFLAFPASTFLLGAIHGDLLVELPLLYAASDSQLASAVHHVSRHWRHTYTTEPTMYFHNLLAVTVFGGVFGGGVLARSYSLWTRSTSKPDKLQAIRSTAKTTDWLVLGSFFFLISA